MSIVWEAEKASYRIQFAEEVLPLIKELIDETYIISTHPEKQKSIIDIELYNQIEKIIKNV
jgi:hypothetical protein